MTEPTERMELYRQVRAVLVRHFVDLGRLSIQIVMQGVRLHGTLVRLPGVPAPMTSEVINAICGELRQIRGIRRIDTDFDNWIQGGPGGWALAEKKPPRGPRIIKPLDQASQAYDLGDGKD